MTKHTFILTALVALSFCSCAKTPTAPQPTAEELQKQRIDSLLQLKYSERHVDSILNVLHIEGVISDTVINTFQYYRQTFIFFDTYGDLVNWCDQFAQQHDTLSSLQRIVDFPYQISRNATWKTMKTYFTSKGYFLESDRDYSCKQFIPNPRFSGSGCPLMENPSYGQIIPERVLNRKPSQYKKYDPATKFWYIYTNCHVQKIHKDGVTSANVTYHTFGDTIYLMTVYYYGTPFMHDLYIEKFGTPIFDDTYKSSYNGSDSINDVVWEFKNMLVSYEEYLREGNQNSVLVKFIEKDRLKRKEAYDPIMSERLECDRQISNAKLKHEWDSIEQARKKKQMDDIKKSM